MKLLTKNGPQTVREQLLSDPNIRLARMRMGQDACEFVNIPSEPEMRIAMVPLTEHEMMLGLSIAASIDVPDNPTGWRMREKVSLQSDLTYALREPSDLTQRVFETIEELTGRLEPWDVEFLSIQYISLCNRSSPSIDGMTEEQLDFLQNAWRRIQLSELTGRRWAAAKICLSESFPELLAVRSSTHTSTSESIGEKSNDTPI